MSDLIERLQRENEELRQRLAVEEAHSDKYRCENEELRNAIDQEMVIAHLGVFNRGDDPVKAIKELMLWSQGVGEYFAKEKLAALKAQSTEPFGYWHQGETYEESEFFLASESGDVRCDDCPVAVIKRNESGQITMQAPDVVRPGVAILVTITSKLTPSTPLRVC